MTPTRSSSPARPRRRHLGWIVPAGLLVLAIGGCAGEVREGDADLQVRWTFEPAEPTVGRSDIVLDVSDVDWSPRNGARVVITGSRDGVALTVDTARGQGAGRYVASGVRFEVAGDWLLRARVETTDGRWVEVERPLRVEVPGADPGDGSAADPD
jgi:hypothetical protein